MLKIAPYSRDLLEDFKYDGVESALSGQRIVDVVDFYASLGSCYVGIIDGKVIGTAGVYPLWNGAGSAFLFLNKEAAKYKLSIYKILLEYMPMLIKQYNIKTLMINCTDNIQARTLVTHLGFVKNREIKMGLYHLGGR